MTTAPTPSEKVPRLAITLEIASSVPDMNYVTVPRHVARDASEELRRLQAENERLRVQVGRFQGIPLPLIEAINAATGSHDWQGEAGPDALAEPACKAIAALQAERDEADRRAGAAERSAAAFHEDNQRFEQVRRRMKEQWGVHNNVSFDVVWQQALDAKQALAELEARKPLPPDALADKCEAWLQAGGASNIVDAFEAGYRAAEGITGGSS